MNMNMDIMKELEGLGLIQELPPQVRAEKISEFVKTLGVRIKEMRVSNEIFQVLSANATHATHFNTFAGIPVRVDADLEADCFELKCLI